jgi:heat shock protein HtpX
VIAHELAHVRNGDSRYGLFVAILIGLVVLLADGFLRTVMEAWNQGVFLRGAEGSDDAKGAAAGLVAGLAFGLALLLIAVLLRCFAPLFAVLVQAAVSRERELLADATAVELTRNPLGLERALETIRQDSDRLKAANRGTQHLWFVNPLKEGSDRAPGLLATHPSIETRIERLRLLRGEGAVLAARQPDR